MISLSDTLLGVLSWRAPRTISATLANHSAHGLPSLFRRALVLFQEGTDAERRLATDHGYESLCVPENLGIYGGVRRIACELDGEYLVMLENDHAIVEPPEALPAILERARADLADGADVVRLCSRTRPGHNAGISKYLRAYSVRRPLPGAETAPVAAHPVQRVLRQVLRGWRERIRLAEAVHVEADPAARHPALIRRSRHGNFLVSSAYAQWTNQCYMIRRDFLLNTLLAKAAPDAEARPISERTIEGNLPRGWWQDAGHTVALSDPGVFTHARLDR